MPYVLLYASRPQFQWHVWQLCGRQLCLSATPACALSSPTILPAPARLPQEIARSVAERMRQQVQYDHKLHEAEQMLDNSGMALNAMEHNIEDLLAHNQALGQQVEALQAQLQSAEAASAALQQEVADAKQAKLKVLDQKAEVEAVAIRWQTEVMKLQVSTGAAAFVQWLCYPGVASGSTMLLKLGGGLPWWLYSARCSGSARWC